MRISDWSSDVCSSELHNPCTHPQPGRHSRPARPNLRSCRYYRGGAKPAANPRHHPLVGLGRMDGLGRVGKFRAVRNEREPALLQIRTHYAHADIADSTRRQDIIEGKRHLAAGDDRVRRIGKGRLIARGEFLAPVDMDMRSEEHTSE